MDHGQLVQSCRCLGSEETGGERGCRETAMDR